MNRIRQLSRFGQSIWIDYISRRLLAGGLQRLVAEDGLRGLTSNPAIFEKAITHDEEYRSGLIEAARRGERDAGSIYERLAFEDISMAADQMEPVYRATGGRDGFVSLEVAPRYAHDTARTVEEARRLWRSISRPNLMIKVPATPAGLPAIEALIADGINVNVTLLFSVEVYEQVARAYQGGLARRVAAGGDIARIGSVASFFVSRIDTAVDKLLEKQAASAGDAQRNRCLGCGVARPLPAPSSRTSAIRRCMPARHGGDLRSAVRACSACCGQARAPRIQRMRTRCTWTS